MKLDPVALYILEREEALLTQLRLLADGGTTFAVAKACGVLPQHISRVRRKHKEFLASL